MDLEIRAALVGEEQDPGGGAQDLAHLLHDEREHLARIERAREAPPDVVEGLEGLDGAPQLAQLGIVHVRSA
ncbi:MAG: hypothetical protein ACJ79L_01850 [Anaeromyxobacteraceae bacterium]